MELKDKLTIAGLLVALAGIISKMKVFEVWLDGRIKRWSETRSSSQPTASHTIPMSIWEEARKEGKTELQTMILVIREEYKADRVTLIEFTPNPDKAVGGLMATVIEEERTSRMPSVREQMQNVLLLKEVEDEIYRIHAKDCHCSYVQAAQLVEQPDIRASLASSGVASAYYQTLPASGGHAGALLSISWKVEKHLSKPDLRALHNSGLGLCGVLRVLWKLQTPALPS